MLAELCALFLFWQAATEEGSDLEEDIDKVGALLATPKTVLLLPGAQ